MQHENNKAQFFALDAHRDQMYGKYPYMVHLGFVNFYINKYKHLLSSAEEVEIATSSGWLHDTLEDCQNVSLNLLEAEFGKNVADTVKALTNVEGLYNLDELKANKIAFFVKLCDRLANIFFLKINFKESAYLKYQDQFKKIKENCPVEFNHLIMEMSDIFKELKEIQKTYKV